MTVGAVGLVLIALLLLAVPNWQRLPIIGGAIGYTADFAEAGGLVPGDHVTVAGVRVGQVTAVRLAGPAVAVDFTVLDTWLGDQTTASVRISTVLGGKYLALDPVGDAPLDPRRPIPVDRTTSAYDVMQAFSTLSDTIGRLDTARLSTSFAVLAQDFANTPASFRAALRGLSAVAATIAQRDVRLGALLGNTRALSGTLAARDDQLRALLADGNVLLGMVRQREQAITVLLTGTEALAGQLTGLVRDDQATLRPALDQLAGFDGMLRANQDSLARSVALLAPFVRLLTNVVGTGRWADGYLCGLLPPAVGPVNPGGC